MKQPYVLTVNKRQPTPINFQTCDTEDLARSVNFEDWHRLSAGAGTFMRAIPRRLLALNLVAVSLRDLAVGSCFVVALNTPITHVLAATIKLLLPATPP